MRLKRLTLVILLTPLSLPLFADDFLGGSRPTCDPTIQTCLPEPEESQCDVTVCFMTVEAQRQYEIKHDCVFPSSSPCGEFDTNTQCCGRNPRTGKAAIIDKVFSTPGVLMPDFDSFTWANLKMACPNLRQNNAPPDDEWIMCRLNSRHNPNDPDDHYNVIEILNNGTSRPFCIDGCSTPPLTITLLYTLGYFLEPDRNNPSGYSEESSFLTACTGHDVCYQTCQKEQNECDREFLEKALNACRTIPRHRLSTRWMPTPMIVNTRNQCIRAANVMHRGLQIGGHSAFNKRRQQYCQCC